MPTAISSVKQDFLASITVALVAIPLCLGIALACNVSLISGLISGVIGGIVVGFISESRVSVSGPAAGMIAVIISIIATLHSFEAFLFALVIAGIIQLIAGLLKGGFIANYVPTNVIQGLLAAIGILIILKQLPIAIGLYAKPNELIASLKGAEENLNLSYLFQTMGQIRLLALIVTLVSLAILLSWDKCFPKIAKIVPASVVVIIVAIILNSFANSYFPGIGLKNAMLVNIPVTDSFKEFLQQFKHPNFSALTNIDVYTSALMIAVIASLETLLNIEGIEKIDKRHRYTSRNRELIAQGAGNILCGLLGGLPVTSVIVRSSVNIYAGARTKLSTILHGFFLLISITFLGKLLNHIPLAALASILIYTGYKLTNVGLYRKAYQEGKRYFIPFLITTIAIVFTNLLLGIFIGLTTSIIFILYYNSKNGLTIVTEQHTAGEVLRFILPQQITFLEKAAIVEALNKIPKASKVIIDANATDYIDNDVLNVIKDFKDEQSHEKKILLNLTGFKRHYSLKDQTKFINATTRDAQKNIDHAEALTILKEGNKRFVQNTPIHKDYKHQILATSTSQHPIAVVLSCIDSRVPVEIVFDQTLGDLFVARVAGNVATKAIMGSLEFACEVAKTKLVVILGHEECGAIQAACDNVKLGNVTHILDKIKFAIDAVKKEPSTNQDNLVTRVVEENVKFTKEYILANSTILHRLYEHSEINIVGAVYDIHTGKVKFGE